MVFARRLLAVALATMASGSCAVAPYQPWVETRREAGVPVGRPAELVVLVHGMGRTRLSMVPLARTLERAGYEVLNWGYSSTCCGISELGDRLSAELRAHPAWGTARVHFVGHSLGNIIIRSVLARGDPAALEGRVVMLAPPNQGSAAADRLSGALAWLLVPLRELTTESMRNARGLELPPSAVVGVIAGRYDWKVPVSSTRLEGISAHLVVPSMHTFIMFREDVHRHVLAFLNTGEFGSGGR